MPASIAEQILARVQAALLAAATDAGTRIHRGRTDAFDPDQELPAVNLLRGGEAIEPASFESDEHRLDFDLQCLAAGDAWETAADALFLQVNAVLLDDAALAGLTNELTLTATDAEGDRADARYGRITVRYACRFFTLNTDPAIRV